MINVCTVVLKSPIFFRTMRGDWDIWVQSSINIFPNMAASAAQTRVKEEVERSIEKLEKEQLRGLQVSRKSAGACVT